MLDGLVHDDSKIAGSVSSSDADHEHCVVFMIFMSSKIADQIMEFLAELGLLESGEYSQIRWSQPTIVKTRTRPDNIRFNIIKMILL